MDNQKTPKNTVVMFIANVHALRIFHEHLGPKADEHDQNIVRQVIEALSELFPSVDHVGLTEDGLAFYTKPPGGNTTDAQANGGPYGSDPEATVAVPEEDLPDEIKEVNRRLQNKDILRTVNKIVGSASKRPPMQGNLLRRGALATLVSAFDTLVADLIRYFYSQNPEAIPAENRSLSLAKLKELGSIEDAESFLISKEVDGVLWGSLDSQLKYVAKNLHVDLAPLGDERDLLIEVF